MATPGISSEKLVQSIDPSPPALGPAPSAVGKKKLSRRLSVDRSQLFRRIVQFAFLALNLWIGLEFYAWVRFFESGGVTKYVERPAGVDGWLPIDALMNLKLALLTGSVPRVHPAGMFLLLAFLAVSLLLHKALCSWLCPVGTLSEYLWKLGRKLLRRNFQTPRWVDIPLRALKYLLLAFFVWIIGRMSVETLAGFLSGPYGIIADVKMLNFFRHLGQTGAIVLAVLTLLSLVVQNFWCRYLCPYGALVGLTALLSPARIRREPGPCIDCGKCAKACPAWLPVDRLVEIRSAECTACMECIAVCPAQGALQLSVSRGARQSLRPRLLGWKGTIAPWAMAACIAAVFLSLAGYARLSGHWQTRGVPNAIYMRLVPNADSESHPGM
jgi:polyferredoxin